ncbi:hypothetical protein FIU92_16040 [Ruegeria sp. THAF33]|nr:hypothetical protein FIU92_16040 [Ruegeria sp. THAF33]
MPKLSPKSVIYAREPSVFGLKHKNRRDAAALA